MASKQNPRSKEKAKKISTMKQDKEFSLKDVLDFGGEKGDYEMLKNIDDSSDIETGGEGMASLNKDEIISVIHDLGLDKVISEDMVYSPDMISHESGEEDDSNEEKGTSGSTKTSSVLIEDTKNKKISANKTEATPQAVLIDQLTKLEIPETQANLTVSPGGKWFDQVPEDPRPTVQIPVSLISQLHHKAKQAWEKDCTLYTQIKSRSKGSDGEWLRTVVSSGTLGDKIAALTLQVQESPVHQVKALDLLLAMTKKKGRRESVMATDTLKDLWLQDLLPENRKLRTFAQQPFESLAEGGGRKRLILWHFEDLLKARYAEFVSSFERLLGDSLPEIRNKALGSIYDLLSERPEQEQFLLRLLVNKVGDPDRKIASKASHLIRCLVNKHPNMKMVVTQAVEYLLYRPNIGVKAQYYSICFLNQMVLGQQDTELAIKLITIYFSFFKSFVAKGEVETKMLSALLTGINRAFPYVKGNDEMYNEQFDTIFRVVHISSFNTSVQALMLLLQVMSSRQSVSDRFYQALYTKMLDPNLCTSSKQAMFLNILFKSMKTDTSLARVKAFVKRLLQVCCSQHPSLVCGSLFLVSELLKIKPGIKSLIEQSEDNDDEEHFVDIPNDDDDDESPSARQPCAPCPERYDMKHRNPLYCHAERSCLWEVTGLSGHYHPSVSHFANLLQKGEPIQYNGDPLQDFTLMRFLDRFVYKNPKTKAKDHGGSLMQPKNISLRLLEEPVNSKMYLNKEEKDIREDEVFFYRYFKTKAHEEESKKKKSENDLNDFDKDDSNDMSGNVHFDFARELKKTKKEKKSDDGSSGTDSGDELNDDSEAEEFDYEDMEAEDEEEEPPDPKRKLTDRDYEKALLDNISSDEFESDDEKAQNNESKKMKTSGNDISSLFASADEFAHLLETSDNSAGGREEVQRNGAGKKQIKWEQRQQVFAKTRGKRENQFAKTRGTRGTQGGGRGTRGTQGGGRGERGAQGGGRWERGAQWGGRGMRGTQGGGRGERGAQGVGRWERGAQGGGRGTRGAQGGGRGTRGTQGGGRGERGAQGGGRGERGAQGGGRGERGAQRGGRGMRGTQGGGRGRVSHGRGYARGGRGRGGRGEMSR